MNFLACNAQVLEMLGVLDSTACHFSSLLVKSSRQILSPLLVKIVSAYIRDILVPSFVNEAIMMQVLIRKSTLDTASRLLSQLQLFIKVLEKAEMRWFSGDLDTLDLVDP